MLKMVTGTVYYKNGKTAPITICSTDVDTILMAYGSTDLVDFVDIHNDSQKYDWDAETSSWQRRLF